MTSRFKNGHVSERGGVFLSIYSAGQKNAVKGCVRVDVLITQPLTTFIWPAVYTVYQYMSVVLCTSDLDDSKLKKRWQLLPINLFSLVLFHHQTLTQMCVCFRSKVSFLFPPSFRSTRRDRGKLGKSITAVNAAAAFQDE